MGGHIRDFGAAQCVGLENGRMSCEIITYGGALRSLTVPDRTGRGTDVVLGFDRLEDYKNQSAYLGALVGRVANRIAGARFELGGRCYELCRNDGENSLHGGGRGFNARLWRIEERSDTRLVLALTSPDGEEGYPGRLEVRVCYELGPDELGISYEAVSDADTLCNLTNHAYFNLNGHDSGSVEGQYVSINASRYTPTDAGLIPTGELADVTGTPMDLRVPVRIGDRVNLDFEALRLGGGFDHNYAIDGADGSLRPAASAYSPETGITLEALTTMPGVQLYTGNFMEGLPAGKGGAAYGNRQGFCLETQHFPDAVHHPNFPSAVLRAGDRYRNCTVYRFGTRA